MDAPTLILVFSNPTKFDSLKERFSFRFLIGDQPCNRNLGSYLHRFDCWSTKKSQRCDHEENKYCKNCDKLKKLQEYRSFCPGNPTLTPTLHIYFVMAMKNTKPALMEMMKWATNIKIVIPTDVIPSLIAENIIRVNEIDDYVREMVPFVPFVDIRETLLSHATFDVTRKWTYKGEKCELQEEERIDAM